MTFGEGPDASGFDYEANPEDPEFDFPIIAGDTEKALAELHGRARTDYETWKRDFLNWLYHEGKKPDRGEGFAAGTRKLRVVDLIESDVGGLRIFISVFVIGGTGAIPRPSGRGYAPSLWATFNGS